MESEISNGLHLFCFDWQIYFLGVKLYDIGQNMYAYHG